MNSSTIHLAEIEKQLLETKISLENEKNYLINHLLNLKKEEDVLNLNIAYFENCLKNMEDEEILNNISPLDNENINDDYLFLEDKIDTSNINFQNGQKNMF